MPIPAPPSCGPVAARDRSRGEHARGYARCPATDVNAANRFYIAIQHSRALGVGLRGKRALTRPSAHPSCPSRTTVAAVTARGCESRPDPRRLHADRVAVHRGARPGRDGRTAAAHGGFRIVEFTRPEAKTRGALMTTPEGVQI